ncbi:DUF3368 domain-containing protein [Thermococcus sp.]|uniref:DUF3368 domain-containing protein n=2 Tax=Thermococcus sp. TaxID=35749 RepID=UPI0026267C2D|nr:DUF3368 domain-containing protein [Thermococcus sp.]
MTTPHVIEEFKIGVRRGRYPPVEIPLEVTELTEEEKNLYERLSRSLGRGEASCIAVARNRGLIFLSDDYDARKKARLLGVKVSGTIGLLVLGVKKNVLTLDEADKLLQKMIELGFYSPIKRIEEIMPSSSP